VITNLFLWIEERLDRGLWFRRSYLAVALAQNLWVVQWSADFALVSQRQGMEVAAIIGAIGGMSTALTAHAFQVYANGRT
jgi:hypothetical protein